MADERKLRRESYGALPVCVTGGCLCRVNGPLSSSSLTKPPCRSGKDLYQSSTSLMLVDAHVRDVENIATLVAPKVFLHASYLGLSRLSSE